MKALFLLFLAVLGVTVALCSAVVEAEEAENDEEDLIQPLIDWVVSKGGFFNDGLEIRNAAGAFKGMFATADIPSGNLLLEIPRETLVSAGDDADMEADFIIWCPTAFNLADAFREGDASDYAPYANYLRPLSAGSLPSAWSVEGRSLLLELLALDDDDPSNDLPPKDPISWIDPYWYDSCDNTRDPLNIRAALFLLQRGWDDIMIPVYDMMNHRNGKWLNTETHDSVHDWSKPIQVYASRDIHAGDQIYTTYNYCEDCGRRDYGYGTPEILSDYGFVESFPQRWFMDHEIAFELDENEGTGNIELQWLHPYYGPSEDAIWFMTTQLRRLDQFEGFDNPVGVSEFELDTLKQYRQALLAAMLSALDYACSLDGNRGTNSCAVSRQYLECRSGEVGPSSCSLMKVYDDLDEKEDTIDYAIYTCDTSVSMSFEGFDTVETLQSHYQDIEYVKNRENDNVCFTIGNIIQICDSYRPQYHEMMVHYTARFLKQVKRILWVGGGDSMLLHEMLKYPSLELAVGLELDQTITRYSFKHMGAQPHWDNEKVQWWYGDAAKSLLMLPADYFGSFDMVLVDLSETVMSLSVTDELDILQALSLLLKPEGIFVKNELYMDQLSSMFRYSFQMHYPYVPVVCSQCMVLGSNRIDFLYDEIRDHKLEGNLYIKPLSSIPEPYEFYHDYAHNSTANILCKEGGEMEPETSVQTRSPGILMVIEIEEAGGKLKDPKWVLKVVEKCLKKAGLHPVARVEESGASGEHGVVGVVLEEGYVIVRTFPANKYAAVDFHLWSSFDKHEAGKTSLVKALKGRPGKSTSSYRIVAGGMFGVKTWKEDEKTRGPRATDPCVTDPEPPREKAMRKSVGDIILEEAIERLLPMQGDVVAVVLCDVSGTDCKSVDVLKASERVAQTITLSSCPGLTNNMNEFEEGAIETMTACENELAASLLSAVFEANKIGAVIVDPSAPYALGRLAYEIFRTHEHRLFEDHLVAMSVILDTNEAWRRNFLERFRAEIILQDPDFRAEILFSDTESTAEFGVTTSVDDSFVRRLIDTAASIKTKAGLDSDMRLIKGGQYVEDPDWEWDHFFVPHDYDQKPPFEQWISQQPLGYQVLFQLEKTDGIEVELSVNSIKSALTDALIKAAKTAEAEEGDGMGMENAELHVSQDMGEGCVIVALWRGGSCVALWDGRKHVDLNWFSYDEWWELSMNFLAKFMSNFPEDALILALLDEQPRGIGRVVNFFSDLGDENEARPNPSWAKFTQ